MNRITEKDIYVYDVIVLFTTAKGRTPTYKELADLMQFKSPSSVTSSVRRLRYNGYLADSNGQIAFPRNIIDVKIKSIAVMAK
ncbi:MAG: hypothetical protein FWE25_03285 [Lachnospiraceae bacterium]|nr:hypothetical protein [Lachnospiraceae bacterium]